MISTTAESAIFISALFWAHVFVLSMFPPHRMARSALDAAG
jgi:hypothetical protein